MADCGLRWIGALASIGRIADCTLVTSRCKEPRFWACLVQMLHSWALLGTSSRRLDKAPNSAESGLKVPERA
eukprot:8059474-Alexandrium_andersonii.AAC.1